MDRLNYINLVANIMVAISANPFPERAGPHPLLGSLMKTYTRKRIYEVMVFLYRRGKRIPNFAGYVKTMLKSGFAESETFEVLDMSNKALYGK